MTTQRFAQRRTRRQSSRWLRPLMEALEERTLLSASGFTLSTLQTFNNVSAKIGLAPNALEQDARGNIFGTTSGGGTLGYGTIFEIPAATGNFTVLAQFKGFNGFNPAGTFVVDSQDNIYGAATDGGAFSKGVLYELPVNTSTIVTLYSFSMPVGTHPFGGITADKRGNLFGTTYDGGGPNLGSVFKYSTVTKAFTVLNIFTDGEAGHSTGTLVVDPAGNIYGTTFSGGVNGDGSVFKIFAGSDLYAIVASFDGGDGSNPTGQLIMDAAGSIYGVTSNGGAAGDGAAYVIPAGSGAILLCASFNGDTGTHPAGELVVDATGDFFGTTPAGASNGTGTAYELQAGTNFIRPLATFTGMNTGTQPSGGLVLTHAGRIVGTTSTGGTFDDGILFQLTPASAPATGWIDNATTTTVEGWAYDPAAGAGSIQVALYVDKKFVGNAPANMSRPDLVGVSTNGVVIQGAMHGFDIAFPQLHLAAGKHTVQVFALSSSGGVVNPLLRTVTVANIPPFGVFDVINNGIALGWAYDPNLGVDPVTVKIFVDGTELTTTVANAERDDVNGAVSHGVMIDGANHGISFNLTALSPGSHTITLLAIDPGHPDVLIGTKVLTLT